MSRATTPHLPVFYTYALMDGRKPGPYYYGNWKFDYEPFYIGKGKDGRCYTHLLSTSYGQGRGHKGAKIRKIQKEGFEVFIRLVRTHLTEEKAFELEIKLISKIGRRDQKAGPLTNHTYGGEGPSGRILSKGSRKKLSNSLKTYAEQNKHTVQERSIRAANTKSSKSANEKEETRKKQQIAALCRPKVSKRKRKLIVEKRAKTVSNKTAEEKESKAQSFKLTMSNKTPAQKAAIAEKKRMSWFSKPESERKRLTEARRRSNTLAKTPEERAAFSAKMRLIVKQKYASWTKEQFLEHGRKISEGRRKKIK